MIRRIGQAHAGIIGPRFEFQGMFLHFFHQGRSKFRRVLRIGHRSNDDKMKSFPLNKQIADFSLFTVHPHEFESVILQFPTDDIHRQVMISCGFSFHPCYTRLKNRYAYRFGESLKTRINLQNHRIEYSHPEFQSPLPSFALPCS